MMMKLNFLMGLISGNRSSSFSHPNPYPHHYHHYHHPSSSSQPINVVTMDFNQVTYGDSKETLQSGHDLGNKQWIDQEINGPRIIPGIITSVGRGSEKIARVFSHTSNVENEKSGKEHLKETDLKLQKSKPIIMTISENAEAAEEERSFHIIRKRHDIKKKDSGKKVDKSEKHGKSGLVKNWSFVFDPSGRLCYFWSMIVSLAFLYNFWVIIYRISFNEISLDTLAIWLSFDILSDSIYILDILINFRICYMEEGVLQTNTKKIRQYYMNSTFFYIDCLCLLPLDFLYLSIGFNSVLRGFRLIKIYKFWSFLDRTERHINYPNVFRTLSLLHYILVIFHWNACLYYLLSKELNSSDWFFRPRDEKLCSGVECDYLHAFYWSVLALTTIGDLPKPRTKSEYRFIIVELLLGLFLFATVLGHVANIVTNVSSSRKEFQAKLDSVKAYMRTRRVPDHLKVKVIKWFDYLWMTQKSSDEEKSVQFLPAKLKAEIAIHVHLDTLKRVEIFQNTEAGFLCALVLRLRPILFSPGDYVCRKGEVGKEMYIVNRGRLQVVNDTGIYVLATLRAGSYFGEISILNMGTAGNRRTASVKSVGYSDLFCLSKQDLWDVLKDYPAARIRLEAIAQKRLEKYKREALIKISRGRSLSTPGLKVNSKLLSKVSNNEKLDGNMNQSENVFLTENDSFVNSVNIQKDDSNSIQVQEENVLKTKTLNNLVESKENKINITCTSPSSQPNLTNCITGPIKSYEKCSYLSSSKFQSSPSQTHSHVPSASLPYQYHLLSPTQSAPHCVLTPTSLTFTSSEEGTLLSQEKLLNEIEQLKNRLYHFENENATLNYKLFQQQWEVEERIKGIEMKMIASKDDNMNNNQDDDEIMIEAKTFENSDDEESERNKESFI